MVRPLCILCLIISWVSLWGCSGNKVLPGNGQGCGNYKVVRQGGVLKVEGPSLEQILAQDGMDYLAFPSPDKCCVGVEVLLFSNLQVLRIYCYRDIDHRFVQPYPHIARTLWSRCVQRFMVNVDDVDMGRMRFISWEDNKSFRVELEGLVMGRQIRCQETFRLTQE